LNRRTNILFFFEEVDKLFFDKKKYREWIKMIIKSEGSIPGFLNIIFTNDNNLSELNRRHLKKNYYTDIIAFRYNDANDNKINGDIFISMERVRSNAVKFSQEFEKELLRVVAHGILHLLGYDDSRGDLKKEMEKKEDFYIDQF